MVTASEMLTDRKVNKQFEPQFVFCVSFCEIQTLWTVPLLIIAHLFSKCSNWIFLILSHFLLKYNFITLLFLEILKLKTFSCQFNTYFSFITTSSSNIPFHQHLFHNIKCFLDYICYFMFKCVSGSCCSFMRPAGGATNRLSVTVCGQKSVDAPLLSEGGVRVTADSLCVLPLIDTLMMMIMMCWSLTDHLHRSTGSNCFQWSWTFKLWLCCHILRCFYPKNKWRHHSDVLFTRRRLWWQTTQVHCGTCRMQCFLMKVRFEEFLIGCLWISFPLK